MKGILLTICLMIAGPRWTKAQQATPPTPQEQELIDLSKQKWKWMADKKVDTLNDLLDDKAMFVHMGGSWGKARELEIIKGGFIWYKQTYVYSASVNIFGNTAILLNDIDLVATVGGKDAINPFMVTEVYLKESGKWKLAQLTFSHLARQLRIKTDSTAQPQQQ